MSFIIIIGLIPTVFSPSREADVNSVLIILFYSNEQFEKIRNKDWHRRCANCSCVLQLLRSDSCVQLWVLHKLIMTNWPNWRISKHTVHLSTYLFLCLQWVRRLMSSIYRMLLLLLLLLMMLVQLLLIRLQLMNWTVSKCRRLTGVTYWYQTWHRDAAESATCWLLMLEMRCRGDGLYLAAWPVFVCLLYTSPSPRD